MNPLDGRLEDNLDVLNSTSDDEGGDWGFGLQRI
jgi:hypothetical protein